MVYKAAPAYADMNDADYENYPCSGCDGSGFSGHNCGEDTCCCLDPEINIPCDLCNPFTTGSQSGKEEK